MATQNSQSRSTRHLSFSSTPSLPTSPTSGASPNSWSFLNDKPQRPDRSREDVKSRKRRAVDVWERFRKSENDEAKRDKSGQSLMYCKECDSCGKLWATAITTNARAHLANLHQIYVDVEESKGKKIRQVSLQTALQMSVKRQIEKNSEDAKEIRIEALNEDAFYEAQIQLITRRRLPFNCVEWPEYQALLVAINPEVENLLIKSHTTVPIHIERSFKVHHCMIKKHLQNAQSQIHYSIDLWSSPNRKSFLGICAQFVDHNYTLRKALLSLPQCRFSHSGEMIARHVLKTIKAYEVVRKTGYIVGDNASSNDTCCKTIAETLEESGVEFNAKTRRIRCSGHVINLSLDAFLFANTVEALEAAIDAAKEEADITVVEALQEQLHEKKRNKKGERKRLFNEAGWQSIGALGSLHNIAVYIRSSTILTDEWEALAGKLLGIDNVTRWNSWYKLISLAVEKQDALNKFCQKHHRALGDAVLSAGDWETLTMTLEFLQPFSQATLTQEANWSSLDQALWTMDILFKHYEEAKVG